MPQISGRNFFFDSVKVPHIFTEDQPFNSTPTIVLPFTPTSLIITNDSTNKILYFSFNGRDIDGFLNPKETPITFDGGTWAKLYLSKSSGGLPITARIWAWRK